MMTATPTRQMTAPMMSYRSGRNPSATMPHASKHEGLGDQHDASVPVTKRGRTRSPLPRTSGTKSLLGLPATVGGTAA